MADVDERVHPIQRLEHEDLEFTFRFVLASGSLKEVAARYGVSYPTIRARLDRLIERLKLLDSGRRPDPMAELLSDFVHKGVIPSQAAKRVLELHRSQLDGRPGEDTWEESRR